MKYQAGDYEAVHRSPVWRDRANYIFHAYLGAKDGRNEWEQLWGRTTGAGTCILCCIPFFADDLALGDEVQLDSNSVAGHITKPSGQLTFRIWFGDQTEEAKELLVTQITKMTYAVEWSSDNLLAVSVAEADAQAVADWLQAQEAQQKLVYATGRR